jgi:hypothetical protein
MTRILPLLFLSACAGDPFTLLALPDAGPGFTKPDPSPPDAGAEHVEPPDAGTHIDAPPEASVDAPIDAPVDAPPEATPDAGPEVSRIDADAPEASPPTPVDAGVPDSPWTLPDAGTNDGPYVLPDACTPFPAPITWNPSCDGVMATVPSDYFLVLGNQACGGQPMGAELAQATPKPCQCRETYSCACLDAYGVCGNRHPTSCTPPANANSEIVVSCN